MYSYPECLKTYWREYHIDATGPRYGSSFLVEDFLQEGETLYRVLAAQRIGRRDALRADTLRDLTDQVVAGRLYWDLPGGEWRIYILALSPHGLEEHTSGHVNPIDTQAVARYKELVYEAHYARFSQAFGKVIAGFFTDEPRFGNIGGYACCLGQPGMPIPYSRELEERLAKVGGGDFARLLPCLWYEAGDVSADVRYHYMDEVSRLFASCFTGQLGDWCRAHGVKLIGHVVEENGAHARLGFGAGHFFRAMEGLDAAGIDVVCNLYPEQTSGSYTTLFNVYDCDFNHWGLAKMASSAAHLDPKKGGVAVCEAFGAYGWSEGLRLMKWITDALAVRGITGIIPHAFDPAPFPDWDCPPHFYAHGRNPQWPAFSVWAAYANRLCRLLRDARHHASVAVLYHAEAEWGSGPNGCDPFEKVVKALMQCQIDCDVLPGDSLLDEQNCSLCKRALRVGEETYAALVVPYARQLPYPVAAKITALAGQGLPVYFMRGFPQRCYDGGQVDYSSCSIVAYEQLVAAMAAAGACDFLLSDYNPDVLCTHYEKEGMHFYLLINQSTQHEAACSMSVRLPLPVFAYDPMEDTAYSVEQQRSGGHCRFHWTLQPYESICLIFSDKLPANLQKKIAPSDFQSARTLPDCWEIAAAETYPDFRPLPYTRLVNLAAPDKLPDFSGTIRYTATFDAAPGQAALLDLGDVYETATVFLNDQKLAIRICPPYRYAIPADLLRQRDNHLVIEVINTLVKAEHSNPFDKFFPQEPTGLIGPVKLYQ